jgi:hypothetical protein
MTEQQLKDLSALHEHLVNQERIVKALIDDIAYLRNTGHSITPSYGLSIQYGSNTETRITTECTIEEKLEQFNYLYDWHLHKLNTIEEEFDAYILSKKL